MAKAKRKRKPTDATGKVVDLLDIPRARTGPLTPSELRKRKKMLKQVAQMFVSRPAFEFGRVLALPTLGRLTPPARPKDRLQPQQELCRRVFPRLFPDGHIPDEIELSTTSLRQMIAVELEREAKQTGKKPLRTPSWDVVRTARRNP
jgi:hypothetical protein